MNSAIDQNKSEASNQVFVSVVIPCRNEEDHIQACVNSVLTSNYPGKALEIFVCDGLSDDKTQEVVANMAHHHPNLKLLLNNNQTTPHGLNQGIQASTGDVVIILGAHASISTDYISKCVQAFHEDDSLGCVGGVLDNKFSDIRSEAIANAMSHPFGVGSAHFRTGKQSGYVDTVAFGAYRKAVFDKIGMFDEALTRNQDDEFNYRVIRAGYKIKLDTTINATYFVRAAFGKLFKQYYQYGYWKVFVNRKHKTVTTFRQVVPALFVFYILLGALIAPILPVTLGLYAGGLGCYVILGLVSAFSKSSQPYAAFMTFYSFIILHTSYGIGYWMGLYSFMLLRRKPKAKNATLSR